MRRSLFALVDQGVMSRSEVAWWLDIEAGQTLWLEQERKRRIADRKQRKAEKLRSHKGKKNDRFRSHALGPLFLGAGDWGVRKLETSRPAVVYVMAADRFCKIGVTANLPNRLINIRTHCPLPVTVVYTTDVLPRGLASWIELSVHRRFIDKCSNGGEWFEISADEAKAAVQAAEFFA